MEYKFYNTNINCILWEIIPNPPKKELNIEHLPDNNCNNFIQSICPYSVYIKITDQNHQ